MKTIASLLTRVLVMGAAAALAAPTTAQGAAWDWDFNIFAGQRSVGEKEWDPFERYDELGVETSWGPSDQPLRFAADLYFAQEETEKDGIPLDSTAQEINLGLRKIWILKKRWRPYFGAGLALSRVEAEQRQRSRIVSDDDLAPGIWFGGGLVFRIASQLNLGVAARFSPHKDLRVHGKDREGSSTHFGIIVGWGSPPEASE